MTQKSPSGQHHTTSSGYICATKGHIDNRKKNFLNSNTSSTCPRSMANFSPLTAEIGSVVWDTPGNFNGFRILAAFTARHSSSGCQPNFAALNRGRHHVGHWPTF